MLRDRQGRLALPARPEPPEHRDRIRAAETTPAADGGVAATADSRAARAADRTGAGMGRAAMVPAALVLEPVLEPGARAAPGVDAAGSRTSPMRTVKR